MNEARVGQPETIEHDGTRALPFRETKLSRGTVTEFQVQSIKKSRPHREYCIAVNASTLTKCQPRVL